MPTAGGTDQHDCYDTRGMGRSEKNHEQLDAATIDERYGLEPVLELDAPADALEAFLDVHCPYCGETYGLAVDLSAGDRTFIEDCTVCCHPIVLSLETHGNDASLRSERPG